MTTERIQQLLESFDNFDDNYKLAELEEALTLREEITHHLLTILESLVAEPDLYIDEGHYGNIYASALLSHFREPRAHSLLIRAFSLDRNQLDSLWGDVTTETLPAMLLNTCDGSLAEIEALVRNPEADEFVRSSAMAAITYAVVNGLIDRRQALDFFATLFDRSLADEDSYFWLALANSIEDLEGIELIGEVRALIADDLIPEGEIAEWFTQDPPQIWLDGSLDKLRDEFARRLPQTIHDYCSWFGCFCEPRVSRPGDLFSAAAGVAKARGMQKNKARKNRKLAKKSKRKNRK